MEFQPILKEWNKSECLAECLACVEVINGNMVHHIRQHHTAFVLLKVPGQICPMWVPTEMTETMTTCGSTSLGNTRDIQSRHDSVKSGTP